MKFQLNKKSVFWTGLFIVIVGFLYSFMFNQGGREIPVSFEGHDGAKLSGLLILPNGIETPPVFIMIHGSGPSPKEEMRWYADKLVKRGYAALIYDKRGVGSSEGPEDFWRYFSFDILASDVIGAVNFLKNSGHIDTQRINLFGASQGGWVAPLAASMSEQDIESMVIVSGPVTSVAEDRIFERGRRLRGEGFTPAELEEVKQLQLLDHEFSRDSTALGPFKDAWDENKSKRWFRRVYLSEEPIPASSKWRKTQTGIIDFDPVPILASLKIPIVWIFGDPDLDDLGPVEKSMQNLQELKSIHGKDYLVLQYDGYDHNLEKKKFFGLIPTYAKWEGAAFRWLEEREN